MKLKQALLWLFGLLVMSLIIWLIAQRIEFYDSTERSAWSSKAKTNPYYAAIEFLNKSDVDVLDINSLNRLKELNTASTVLITNSSQINNPRQLKKVMDWLKQGGNLIIAPSQLSDDIFLAEFEISIDQNDDKDSESFSETLIDYNKKIEAGMSVEEINNESEDEIKLTEVDFGEETSVLSIAFASKTILTHPVISNADEIDTKYTPLSWSSSDEGVTLIQFAVGDGSLTVLADSNIWNSFHIDEHDHAYLLWLLINKNGSLALFHNTYADSIWSLMKKNTSELLIAFMLFIALFLWHKMFRFGRIERYHNKSARSLNEHFYTVANFLWHRQGSDTLLMPLRDKILRKSSLIFAHKLNKNDNNKQHYKLLSQFTKINLEHIEMAFENNDKSELNFIQTVKTLIRIEKLL